MNAPADRGRSAFGFLVRGQPARFISDGAVAESVERLKAAQRNPPPSRSQRVDGTVTAEQVRLMCVVPGRRNTLQPVFTGAFVTEGGRAVLNGRFAPRGAVRLFFILWFGFLLFFTGLGVDAVATYGRAVWWTVGMGVLLFGAGWAFMAQGRQAAQADIDGMSDLIGRALQAAPPNQAPP